MRNFGKRTFSKIRKIRKIFLYIALVTNLFVGTLKRNGVEKNLTFNENQEMICILRGGSEIIYKFKEHPRLVTEIVQLDDTIRSEITNLI